MTHDLVLLGIVNLKTLSRMANTYHQGYVQAIFAVKYRAAVLQKDLQHQIFGVIGNLINATKCKTIIVNGVDDHVHCFLGLKPAISCSNLMKSVKAKSSKHINDRHWVFFGQRCLAMVLDACTL